MENNKLQTTVKETELKLKEAISLPEVSNVLIQLIQQFDSKVELHVHFNIQSVGNLANGVIIGNSNINGNYNTINFSNSNVDNKVQDGGINGKLGFTQFQKQIEENDKRIEEQIIKNDKRIKELENIF